MKNNDFSAQTDSSEIVQTSRDDISSESVLMDLVSARARAIARRSGASMSDTPTRWKKRVLHISGA